MPMKCYLFPSYHCVLTYFWTSCIDFSCLATHLPSMRQTYQRMKVLRITH